jgi:Ni,Fe-hydrogenase III small subunit/NAD-dependent dihydropyrimidine dehydrogenase PreA subunit
MFKALLARARQGYRTANYPVRDPSFPALFRGRPTLNPEKCVSGCAQCVESCPTDALTVSASVPEIDLGRCIFCGECAAACPTDAIAFTQDWRLAASERTGLVVTGDREVRVEVLRRELRRLLGRSLRLRQISAGGCNGCEAEMNALGNVVFDSSRFGIEFVASPRHADGILVTGPVTANMKQAALKTYKAIAEPKLVIAAGACAISGGIFRGHAEVCDGCDGIEDLFAVDLHVPGCPPHPYTVLDGLLRMLGRC